MTIRRTIQMQVLVPHTLQVCRAPNQKRNLDRTPLSCLSTDFEHWTLPPTTTI